MVIVLWPFNSFSHYIYSCITVFLSFYQLFSLVHRTTASYLLPIPCFLVLINQSLVRAFKILVITAVKKILLLVPAYLLLRSCFSWVFWCKDTLHCLASKPSRGRIALGSLLDLRDYIALKHQSVLLVTKVEREGCVTGGAAFLINCILTCMKTP